MKLRKVILFILIAAALSVAACALEWENVNTSTLSSTFGSIAKVTNVATTEFGKQFDKRYTYYDGTFFSTQRLVAESAITQNYVLDSYEVEGSSAFIKYYDDTSKTWISRYLLGDGQFPYGMYFIRVDNQSDMIICLPQAYKAHENDTLEALSGQTGSLSVEKTETGWKFMIMAPYTYQQCNIEFFVLKSDKLLINWGIEKAEDAWSGYQLDGDNRWCFNGYYYTSPSSYVPTGYNYYYRLPAAYIACKLVPMGMRYDAAKYLCIGMLDTMLDLQCDAGYFPTMSGSQWLMDDYGIGAGFYDTRFNTDLARALFQAYKYYGIAEFGNAATRYVNFYLNYAIHHHDSVSVGDGWNGWLVYDYWNEKGGKKTHTSLNHQIAEIALLEEVYQQTGNTLCRFVEEMLMRGIQATEKTWYMSNHNLEYAWMNGKALAGQTDYPYLTYNDMYELDTLFYNRLGYHPGILQRLMASKKLWMDANGVTGYSGTEAWRSEQPSFIR